MPNFGVEFYSDSGYKFIIPDSAGFVFTRSVTLNFGPITTNGHYTIHTESFPTGSNSIAFVRVLGDRVPIIQMGHNGSSLNIVTMIGGSQHTHSYSIKVYFFCDVETTPDNSKYGVRVFNEDGVLIMNAKSKPLRLLSHDLSGGGSSPTNCGAILPLLGGVRGEYDGTGYTRHFLMIPMAVDGVLKMGQIMTGVDPMPFSYYKLLSTHVFYIDTSYYD